MNALHVRREDRDARSGELLGHHLEGLRLPRPRGTGDQAVPVEHAQRKSDEGLGKDLSVVDGGAQRQGGVVSPTVGTPDLVDELSVHQADSIPIRYRRWS